MTCDDHRFGRCCTDLCQIVVVHDQTAVFHQHGSTVVGDDHIGVILLDRLRHIIAPDGVAADVERLFIGAAEDESGGVTAGHLRAVDGVDLDDLRIIKGDPILHHPDVLHAGERQIVRVLPVDGIDRTILVQPLAGLAVGSETDVVQMHVGADVGVHASVDFLDGHGQGMQRARKPIVLWLHGFPGGALVEDVLLARVAAAVHGAHHRDHGETSAHKARRQPRVDQKGLSCVGDFDGRAADLLEFHEGCLLVCFCVYNLTWIPAVQQKQPSLLPQQKRCSKIKPEGII